MTKLIKSNIETPIGILTAIADDLYLYKLLFDKESSFLDIECGKNNIILQLKEELSNYFTGKLHNFTVPIKQNGSTFDILTWNSLMQIPFGQVVSYRQQAIMAGREKSFRAIANANGRNQIMIIAPCHRVIRIDGTLGGYSGGEYIGGIHLGGIIGSVNRKKFLIEHESRYNS